jgi:hypothetical protein
MNGGARSPGPSPLAAARTAASDRKPLNLGPIIGPIIGEFIGEFVGGQR